MRNMSFALIALFGLAGSAAAQQMGSLGGYAPAGCGCNNGEVSSPTGCAGLWSGYVARPCGYHQHFGALHGFGRGWGGGCNWGNMNAGCGCNSGCDTGCSTGCCGGAGGFAGYGVGPVAFGGGYGGGFGGGCGCGLHHHCWKRQCGCQQPAVDSCNTCNSCGGGHHCKLFGHHCRRAWGTVADACGLGSGCGCGSDGTNTATGSDVLGDPSGLGNGPAPTPALRPTPEAIPTAPEAPGPSDRTLRLFPFSVR